MLKKYTDLIFIPLPPLKSIKHIHYLVILICGSPEKTRESTKGTKFTKDLLTGTRYWIIQEMSRTWVY